MPMTKITICGGGNGAQTLACIAARNLGCAVDVYAPLAGEAARLADGIAAHDGLEVCGALQARARPHCVSADPAEVIPGSGMVVLVLPAFAHEAILGQIAPYLDNGVWVGAIPAGGGFGYCAARVLSSLGPGGARLFGLQTLPWACRIQEYGQVVHVLGVKETVDAASRPAAAIAGLAPLFEAMLGLPVEPAASLLALTLANTGQLIHPGIMHGLFARWDGTPFDAGAVALFYHGLDEEGARTLAGLDADVQAIRRRLELEQDLTAVRPLLDWLRRSYGPAIADPSSLRAAFVTNRAYAGLKAPVRELSPGLFVPDFGARYLAEDVPFGLAVSRAIGALAGVETPAMDRVITWAGERLGKDYLGRDALEARIPQRYGLEDIEALMAFTKEGEENDC